MANAYVICRLSNVKETADIKKSVKYKGNQHGCIIKMKSTWKHNLNDIYMEICIIYMKFI